MQLLWLFFIISNLFYVFYFDENVFYFILFSILFLPNFFNGKFYTGQVSVFQYIQYLRTNLANLILFLELTKNVIKKQLTILFTKFNHKFNYYNSIGFISLFKFLAKNVIALLEKNNLIQNLNLIEIFLLTFFKNVGNFLSVPEKKNTIAELRVNFKKTDIKTGLLVLNILNSTYKNVENKNIFSPKDLNTVFSLLEIKNKK